MIKKVVLLALVFHVCLQAQNKPILFGFKEIPQNLMVNPGAKTIISSHVGIPLVSGVSAEANFKGFNLYEVFANDGVNFNVKLNNILNTLNSKDHVSFNQQLEILNAGYQYNEKDYVNFGLYEELDVIGYYPQDLAFFIKYGNTENGTILLNKPRKISQIAFKGELISVAHLGINRKLNNDLIVGARAKLYSGAYNISSTGNTGTLTTVEGVNNIYQHQFRDVNFSFKSSGLDGSNTSNLKQDVIRRLFLSGNLGLGLDVGFTYKYRNNITITGSLLDVGFIAYNSKIKTLKLKGDYDLNGVELFDTNETDQIEFWDKFLDDFNSSLNKKETKATYVTLRPIKLHGAVTYNFGEVIKKRKVKRRKRRGGDCSCEATDSFKTENTNEVGGQLYAVYRTHQPQMALTGFYYRKISDFLRAKVTYTVDSYSYTNIGLGASVHLGNLNFYAMADNLLGFRDLAKSQTQSVQFGLNWIID